MTTETILKTAMGTVQYFPTEAALIEHYNRNGNLYEIKEGKNGRELWHKGHKTMNGVIEIIPARSYAAAEAVDVDRLERAVDTLFGAEPQQD